MYLIVMLFSTALSLRLPTEKLLVFDLGMHIGTDTENYLKRGYRVVAVEANPLLAQENANKSLFVTPIRNGDLKILNVGIKNDRASSSEGLEFWIPDGKDARLSLPSEIISGFASFTKYSACRMTGQCHALKIPTLTCSDLLKNEGTPHYMKLDIEGQDIECLKNIMQNRCGAELPQYVSFENFGLDTFAAYYEEGGKVKELMKLMHERGYTGWKRARGWVDEYKATAGSNEDSSFGEDVLDLETTKVWKPISDFKDQLGCDVDCTDKGICKGWCDMHAKLDSALANCSGVTMTKT